VGPFGNSLELAERALGRQKEAKTTPKAKNNVKRSGPRKTEKNDLVLKGPNPETYDGHTLAAVCVRGCITNGSRHET